MKGNVSIWYFGKILPAVSQLLVRIWPLIVIYLIMFYLLDGSEQAEESK